SFEDQEYLKSLGLKITWHDWEGHTNMMLLADYFNIFARLGLVHYCVINRKPILSTDDPVVIPLSAPINTHEYSEKLGSKPKVKFDRPIYGQFDIFVTLRPLDRTEFMRLIATSIQAAPEPL